MAKEPIEELDEKIQRRLMMAKAICVLNILITLGMMIYAGGAYQEGVSAFLDWAIKGILFMLWAISPFIFCYIPVWRNKDRPKWQLASIGYLLLASLFCIGIYIDIMFIHIDAQGALAFIFAPLYANAGLIAFITVSEIAKAIWKEKD